MLFVTIYYQQKYKYYSRILKIESQREGKGNFIKIL